MEYTIINYKFIMKKFKFFAFAIVGMTMAVMTSCQKNEAPSTFDTKLAGKWCILSDPYSEILVVDKEGNAVSTGAINYGTANAELWVNVKGKLTTNGNKLDMVFEDNDNDSGTYTVNDTQFVFTVGADETYSYIKMLEEFSLAGEWNIDTTFTFIKAVKDSITLPEGSTAMGQDLPGTIPSSRFNGDFAIWAVSRYLQDLKFTDTAIEYKSMKNDTPHQVSKNYTFASNMLTIPTTIGDFEQDVTITVFQSRDGKDMYFFLNKHNVADMFVGFAYQLREDGDTTGGTDTLQEFKQDFLETFESYGLILKLSRK